MDWYILQTKPNAYKIASKNLKQQGFEVFLPLMVKTFKRGGKFVNDTIPLFPSYLFMGSANNKISWSSVNSTKGILRAVTLDGKYRSLNRTLIDGLKRRCNSQNILVEMDDIASGDYVKIEKGPFADFVCQVEKISEKARAWVLIQSLERTTRANISVSDLSKID